MKQSSQHSCRPPSQVQAVKLPSQHGSKTHKTTLPDVSNHSNTSAKQASKAPSHQLSASRSQTRSQPSQPSQPPSQHPSQTHSHYPSISKPPSQARSASKSHKPNQASSNHTQNKPSTTRSSTSYHTAVAVQPVPLQAQHPPSVVVPHHPAPQSQAPP